MKRLRVICVNLFLSFAIVACTYTYKKHVVIEVYNPLDQERINETVTVDLKEMRLDPKKTSSFIVRDNSTQQEILGQLIDEDGDSIPESILFQTNMLPKGTKLFKIESGVSTLKVPKIRTFARLVPERFDDFAWENDKVAFRTYGPKAQRMAENDIRGGIISSGIDCWLKRVDYPIINNWYKRNSEVGGNYHKDIGEGLDNYDVGSSRGCGGIGVWKRDKLYVSKNFSNSKLLSNGPIRSSFILNYNDWHAGNKTIKENNLVSIDLGSNLTKYKVLLKGTDSITVGLKLHYDIGEVSVDQASGWFNYTSPHFGDKLSTCIVVDPTYYLGYEVYESLDTGKSHLLVHLKVLNGKVEYYSGFYWSKSQQFKTLEAWKAYLENQSKCISGPLQVKLK